MRGVMGRRGIWGMHMSFHRLMGVLDLFTLAFGFWLLAFGFWLLAFGFWLLAFGFWLLVCLVFAGYRLGFSGVDNCLVVVVVSFVLLHGHFLLLFGIFGTHMDRSTT